MSEPLSGNISPRQRKPSSQGLTPAIIAGFVLVAVICFGAGFLSSSATRPGGLWALFNRSSSLDTSSLQETYQALQASFDGEIDQQVLIEGANKGMVDALGDEYTVFLNSQEAADFNSSLSGEIGGGIGVELAMRNGVPTVVRLLQNNPAEKAGIVVGDVLAKVNGDSIEGQNLNEVVSKIRGESGTTVKVTVLRNGSELDFSITRQTVNNPSAFGEVKNGVGVLTITRFDNDTASLSRTVARGFKEQNVRSVVLDLRGNGGGFVTAAQDVASIWLNDKVVVSERRGGSVTDELKSAKSPILEGVPTVVLVNQSSASASEIVAGALRDHKAATLMGETTFGKGSVQQLMSLSAGAMLKVTVARWYTPSGVNISETGITPDVTVARTTADINAGVDPQMDRALVFFLED